MTLWLVNTVPPPPTSSVKLGASFTAVTVMVKVLVLLSTPPLAVPPLSCTMTVTVATPLELAAGVKVSVPELSIAGGALKSVALLLFTDTTLTVCMASSGGPGENAANAAPPKNAPLSSSTTTLFVANVTVGASFTAVTVMVKV